LGGTLGLRRVAFGQLARLACFGRLGEDAVGLRTQVNIAQVDEDRHEGAEAGDFAGQRFVLIFPPFGAPELLEGAFLLFLEVLDLPGAFVGIEAL